MKVALVEDADLLRGSLVAGLGKFGWSIAAAVDGEEGWWLLKDGGFDCVVLDIMLPGFSGLELLRRMRGRNDDTPVLLLTARDEVEDRVEGLRNGADDYLTKPFALAELAARIEALVRRRHGHVSTVVRIGPLAVDLGRHRVDVAGTEVVLARREYALLEVLAMRHGQVVSKAELETHLHEPESEPMSNTVEAAIYQLRARLRETGADGLVRTRRGQGYCLEQA